jgi:hypothetical protein
MVDDSELGRLKCDELDQEDVIEFEVVARVGDDDDREGDCVDEGLEDALERDGDVVSLDDAVSERLSEAAVEGLESGFASIDVRSVYIDTTSEETPVKTDTACAARLSSASLCAIPPTAKAQSTSKAGNVFIFAPMLSSR